MKQHITVDQLAESSDKYKDIVDLVIEDDFEKRWFLKGVGVNGEVSAHDMLVISKHMTIGKMIEILKTNEGFDIELARFKNRDEWMIGYYPSYKDGIPVGGCKVRVELCDALWEAVKEVL